MTNEYNVNRGNRRYAVNFKVPQTVRTRSFTWLSITIFTVTFFLIVAIKPTLVTIAKLNKEIKDKTEASIQLQKKIDAIVAAQDIYARNSDNLVLLDDAFPEKSEFPRLAYFFEQISTSSGVIIKSLNFEKIGSPSNKAKDTSLLSTLPLNFSIIAKGDYPQLKNFLTELESSRRIIKITSTTFNQQKKDEKVELTIYISGQASFKR